MELSDKRAKAAGHRMKRTSSQASGLAVTRPPRLADSVYDAIFQKLISLEIPPGDRMSVDDLARTLGISQTPIREALTRLETQGLVVKTHLIGYRAAPQPSMEEFDQLFATRILLEPYAASQAAKVIGPTALDTLEQLLKRVTDLIKDQAPNIAAQHSRIDSDFHRTIAFESGNLVISSFMDSLHVRTQLFLLRNTDRPDPGPSTIEHKRILAALRARDPAAAAKAMRDHLKQARDRYWPTVAGRSSHRIAKR